MIAIEKETEPRELLEYRSKPDAEYDGPEFTPIKDRLRKALLREQGFLCAYCMTRIEDRENHTKIEHWKCQSGFPELGLDYGNLLASCKGNEGRRFSEQHCDTRKGNRDLKFNPARPAHRIEEHVHYLSSGRIESDDPEFDLQLNQVLNLNHVRLIANRLEVFKAVLAARKKLDKQGRYTARQLQITLEKWRDRPDNRAVPYCGVAISVLRKALRKLNAIDG